MNLELIKGRYLNEPFNRRLGHLASDLARVSSFLGNSKNTKAAWDILEESKFFIEWTASEAPLHIQEFFSEIQPKIALWQRHLFNKQDDVEIIKELKDITRKWSFQLIEISGLLAV